MKTKKQKISDINKYYQYIKKCVIKKTNDCKLIYFITHTLISLTTTIYTCVYLYVYLFNNHINNYINHYINHYYHINQSSNQSHQSTNNKNDNVYYFISLLLLRLFTTTLFANITHIHFYLVFFYLFSFLLSFSSFIWSL